MKPFISFFVILILFQTLIFGSLIKLELPEDYTDGWGETCIDKQAVLDPFLIPGKDGINRNINKNEWVPFQYTTLFAIRNKPVQPLVNETLFLQSTTKKDTSLPVYILNGTLRI